MTVKEAVMAGDWRRETAEEEMVNVGVAYLTRKQKWP
jgi:hypothetical protein